MTNTVLHLVQTYPIAVEAVCGIMVFTIVRHYVDKKYELRRRAEALAARRFREVVA
jgi:hypothetical protein